MTCPSSTARVLAIDPTTKGLAYAVFEGPELLLDWGLSQVRPEEKNALCLKRVGHLIRFYAPDVVVLEAYAGKGSHRRPRVRALIRSIARLSHRRGVRCRSFSRAEIRRAFESLANRTRHPIAAEIARRFPELACRLPAVRKFYETEDERMSIFDAVSLALVYYGVRPALKTQIAEPVPAMYSPNDDGRDVRAQDRLPSEPHLPVLRRETHAQGD